MGEVALELHITLSSLTELHDVVLYSLLEAKAPLVTK